VEYLRTHSLGLRLIQPHPSCYDIGNCLSTFLCLSVLLCKEVITPTLQNSMTVKEDLAHGGEVEQSKRKVPQSSTSNLH
jgi:hypothetical protein